MVRDIICDLCHVEVAIVLMGDTRTGEQTAFCQGCRILDCLGTLDQQLNDEAKASVAAQWAAPAKTAKPAEDGAADAPKSRRGARKVGAGVEPDSDLVAEAKAAARATAELGPPEPDGGLEEAPAAAPDG